MVNIQTQPNSCDCGMFAIANATEFAFGKDPCFVGMIQNVNVLGLTVGESYKISVRIMHLMHIKTCAYPVTSMGLLCCLRCLHLYILLWFACINNCCFHIMTQQSWVDKTIQLTTWHACLHSHTVTVTIFVIGWRCSFIHTRKCWSTSWMKQFKFPQEFL